MDNKLSQLRRDYKLKSLDIQDVSENPVEQFKTWFDEVLKSETLEPNSMSLATVSPTGMPSVRTVLLKGLDERGFIFYTNYKSRKGRHIAENPKAGLCFNWLELERQVRVEGTVERLPYEESKAYFDSRPFDSRIGALASEQSAVVHGRSQLETIFRQFREEFENKEVPMPKNWGGYVVKPELIEFWQGRSGRMHDRLEYCLENGLWSIRRLAP